MISIPYALDALNFFAADARNALGPFVNVYLVTDRHWSQTEVGLVATTSGLLGIAFQTPIGAAIDLTPAKRAVIVLSISAMAFASLIIFGLPTFWPMAVAFAVLAIAGDAFAPAVAALTLGVTPNPVSPGVSAGTRRSIMPETLRSPSWRARSATCFRNARSS